MYEFLQENAGVDHRATEQDAVIRDTNRCCNIFCSFTRARNDNIVFLTVNQGFGLDACFAFYSLC